MKLAGVKVVELSQFLPGPHLTMMMADHGAEVIKVEPFSGEPARELGLFEGGQSVWYRNTHRGKKSLRLNLKDARGRDILLRLCENADVLVESFRPGVVDRLGIGYDAVAARAPQIIYASLSAFGQKGRYRDRPAHDMAMQAMAGLLDFNRGRDGKPANPAIPAADLTGSLMALSGILMALLRQRQTGRGDYLDISMHDCLLAWTPNVAGPVFAENRDHVVTHARNWGGAAFYMIYDTADGKEVVLAGIEHKFCENFLNKAGRPDLIPLTHEPPGPVQEPVKAFLREWFGARTQAQALEWLADVDVCYAPLRTLKQSMDDPNTSERGMLLKDPQGNHHLGVPIKFRHEPAAPRLRAPELGEHALEVLQGIGIAAEEARQLAAAGVV
ncbi:MAG: CoA transferase [Burkholderiales bacterium]|nr:CoA transferase [Burkholderiales bacterium]